LFKSKADTIDGVIVTLPNFGDERAIADTLRLSRLDLPVLAQATPDTPSKMAITHRRDSFCGKMSACNNLRQYGIPYSLTMLHTEKPDSPEVATDLEWFAGVCRVVKGLRNLRIGALGAQPTAFNTVRYSEKLLEASGISVETLDLSEVLGRISRIKDTDDVVAQKLSAIQK
jgi:L-fucose isomerase-like protein